MITGFYAAVLALIFIALSYNIIIRRIRHGIGIGDGGNHILNKAVRVHANFAEYVPFALLLMLLCEYTTADLTYIHALGITLIVSRIFHAYGLMTTSVRSYGRTVGVIGTHLVIIFAALFLIMQYVTA